MPDRENVISNLEQQIRWIEEIECHQFPGWLNVTNAMRDAIAMLKEQEDALEQMRLDNTDLRNCNAELMKEQDPVKPRYTPPKSIYSWECGVCGEPFDRIANYCPKCGKAVKWDA